MTLTTQFARSFCEDCFRVRKCVRGAYRRFSKLDLINSWRISRKNIIVKCSWLLQKVRRIPVTIVCKRQTKCLDENKRKQIIKRANIDRVNTMELRFEQLRLLLKNNLPACHLCNFLNKFVVRFVLSKHKLLNIKFVKFMAKFFHFWSFYWNT